MISYDEALEIIANNLPAFAIENLKIMDALGKINAHDIKAQINVPSFDNSAMDGFGVKSEWLENTSNSNPIKIKKSHEIAAGDINISKNDFTTCHIMTGAKIPSWVDAIVPIEMVQISGDDVVFTMPANFGQNIRRIGEDVLKDAIIIDKNTYINPENIMVLAAQGIKQIEVFKTPKLHIISTGNEIISHDDGVLVDGKIYNSNAPFLLAKAKQLGIEADFGGIFADNMDLFEEHIGKIPPNTIIISTGAVSAGKWDFIPEVLKKIGAKIHFHKLNIRPAKPILFAILPNGNLFFGLPGNPISTAIGFNFFTRFAIEKMGGLNSKISAMAINQSEFIKKFGGRQFLKAHTYFEDGAIKTEIQNGQESFKISPMAKANSWAILNEGVKIAAINELIQIEFFDR